MKTKEPIAVISNDWHLKPDNIEIVRGLVEQMVTYSLQQGIKEFIVLGDIFDSRIAQREEVLTAFHEIIKMVMDAGLEVWVIPGNHDKTDYESDNSFLTPYAGNAKFTLITKHGGMPFPKHKIHLMMLPFWSEEVWIERFHEAKEYMGEYYNGTDFKNILLTHIAVTGSRNNDGEYVSSKISTGMFKDFHKVLSGHYHDQQKIGDNFYHLPSIRQNNFGENNQKGMTILYSDGSHELEVLKFKEYVKVKIDIDTTTFEELNQIKQMYSKSLDRNIRFEIVGAEAKVKALKKAEFTNVGIEIVTKYKEIVEDIIFAETAEVVEHNPTTIVEAFQVCCEKEGWDYESGVKYLKKKLNK